MVNVNVCVLAGRVAADPVQRGLPDGSRIVEMRVQMEVSSERTLPLPVIAKSGTEAYAYLAKTTVRRDDEVMVTGQLVRRFYRSGAGARSITEVNANTMKKLEPPPIREEDGF